MPTARSTHRVVSSGSRDGESSAGSCSGLVSCGVADRYNVGMGPQRQRVFEFIIAHCDQFGPPTEPEIACAFGVTKSAVQFHIRALIALGLLARKPKAQRALTVTQAGRKFFVETGPVIRPEPLLVLQRGAAGVSGSGSSPDPFVNPFRSSQ